MLDLYLGAAKDFTDEDKNQLLKKLLEILLVEDELVYEIAWDMPSILLPFFDSRVDFDQITLKEVSTTSTLMNIFKVLTNKGNKKELFLKSIECLGSLQVEPLSEDDERPAEVAERFFELKFVALFELLSATLARVEAQYPSRFLANATAASITFIVEQLDTLSLRSLVFILRRFFMFARDYNPVTGDKEVSELEQQLQARLLQRFVTDVASMALEKYSVKLAQRFFVELKKGVAFNQDLAVRTEAYELDETTLQFDDIVYRITQLAYSFDIEVEQLFVDLIKETHNQKKQDSQAEEEDETESPQEDHEGEESNQFDFTTIKSPQNLPLSTEGIFLLATSARFHDRVNPKSLHLTFSDLIALTNRFLLDSGTDRISAGIQDSLCFWALWVSRKVTAAEIEAVPQDAFFSYLQLLMYIAATASQPDLRPMALSIATRLLGLGRPEARLEFLMDTVESCPFTSIREACIKLLKESITTPNRSSAKPEADAGTDTTVSDSLARLSLSSSQAKPALTLSPAHLDSLQTLVLADLDAILGSPEGILHPEFPVLLSWLNFEAVVETAHEHVAKVHGLGRQLLDRSTGKSAAGDDEEERQEISVRATLLQLGLDLLKSKWNL